jgi:hypothetical protein
MIFFIVKGEKSFAITGKTFKNYLFKNNIKDREKIVFTKKEENVLILYKLPV